MNNMEVSNLNVDYLRNGVYENKLKDVNQSSQSNEFKFNKIFTISNAFKEIQGSSNYIYAINRRNLSKISNYSSNNYKC